MKLLATGAFAQSESELDVFKEQGFDVVFHKDERSPLECDPSEIDVVICNGLFLYCDVALFSNLKAIQLTSAGLDRVPVEEIERRGIKLFNARGVYSVPMAEYVLANVLAVYRENAFYAEMQREKRWEKKRDLDELFGKTLCVVGAGNVGGEVAKRFRAFGVKTIGVDNHVAPRPDFDEIVPLDELYEIAKKADIIVSTVPLIEPIRGTVDATQRNATQRNATQRNATQRNATQRNARNV